MDTAPSPPDPEFVAFTPVGLLYRGDKLFAKPPRAKGRWLIARSVGVNGDRWWINAAAPNGINRCIAPADVLRIVPARRTTRPSPRRKPR
jgi:hypothetical protein